MAIAGPIFLSTGFIMNRYYANVIHLDMKKFWKNMVVLSKGMFFVVTIGFLLKYVFHLYLSWGNIIIFSFINTLLYLFIMYFCMNTYEKTLCLQVLKKLKYK